MRKQNLKIMKGESSRQRQRSAQNPWMGANFATEVIARPAEGEDPEEVRLATPASGLTFSPHFHQSFRNPGAPEGFDLTPQRMPLKDQWQGGDRIWLSFDRHHSGCYVEPSVL